MAPEEQKYLQQIKQEKKRRTNREAVRIFFYVSKCWSDQCHNPPAW